VGKRADLVASLGTSGPAYRVVEPAEDNAYAFRPRVVHADYYRWPKVAELADQAPLLGLLEKRRGALLAFEREELAARLAPYFDPTIPLADLPDELRGLREPAARFDPNRTRRRLLAQGGFRPEAVQRFLFKPLDHRWAYVETTRPLWNEPRPDLVHHAEEGTRFLLVRRRVPRALDGAAFYLTDGLGDEHALHKDAYFIPMRLPPTAAPDTGQGTLDLGHEQPARANLSLPTRTWLTELGVADPDSDINKSELVWLHALAIGYSPGYLEENRDGGRFTYQRVPLPSTLDQLQTSAALGAHIAALLDADREVPGITRIAPAAPDAALWRSLAEIEATHGSRLESADLVLSGWAIVDAEGIIIPGAGVVIERSFTDQERAGLATASGDVSDLDQVLELLGGQARDVRVGPRAQWRNIPTAVWNYRVGGYQVLRKWLSYRDERVLGRPLTVEEARLFTSLVRRITALLLLGPALDRNYLACRDAALPWHEVQSDPP
jgi:Type ISP C-terminal specificity domain